MRLLVDQDVYHITTTWLGEQGHVVVTALELGLQRAPDAELPESSKRIRQISGHWG